jgi:hypothetical protein
VVDGKESVLKFGVKILVPGFVAHVLFLQILHRLINSWHIPFFLLKTFVTNMALRSVFITSRKLLMSKMHKMNLCVFIKQSFHSDFVSIMILLCHTTKLKWRE